MPGRESDRSGRDLRGLRAFRQDESQAHHGLQGDQRQNQIGGGADPGLERVHDKVIIAVHLASCPKKKADESELKKESTTNNHAKR